MEWPLLAVLDDDARREVLIASRRRKFGRGEVIFHEGDPGDSLHLVSSGQIGLRVHTPLGDVAMVRVLGPGDFFGELTVVAPGQRNATAVAVTAAETRSLHRDQFDELQQRHPQVGRVLVEALVHEVRRLSAQLVEVTYLPVEQRVWRRLQSLRTTFGTGGEATESLPVTQDVLAELVGCTRPTVNQVLRAGEADGVIALHRGRIEVLDAELLARRAR